MNTRNIATGFALGLIFSTGLYTALAPKPAHAAVACSDEQSVINTLLAFTTELVREVDAIKIYGPAVVPSTGSGVVLPSNPVPIGTPTFTTPPATITPMDAAQQASDREKARLRALGHGLVRAQAYIGYEGAEAGKLVLQISDYFDGESVSFKVNGKDVPGQVRCAPIQKSDLRSCDMIAVAPFDGSARVVASYEGVEKDLGTLYSGQPRIEVSW